ncbi:ketose-bisphosphate aldolase class-II family protein [Paramyrothecium foliicola]|nr:ketose-bisphosphate aldolase class-II family protein [Paramyrothecium foliicola]
MEPAPEHDHVTQVAFIGLGAMGFGMASNLTKNPAYSIIGFDVYSPSAEKFQAIGGRIAESPRAAAASSKLLVCMVTNAQQIESALFDEDTGAVAGLPPNATILICSTVPPSYHEELSLRLTEKGRSDIHVVDAPVAGGTVRAAAGNLTIFASGEPKALQDAESLLHEMSEKLYIVPGTASAASKVKMLNQLLVGVHIATAAEAMGLAAKAGLNTREVYEIITNAAGNSWAFENRVPHMLEDDWTPHSALDIFVKDMGIVMSTARSLQFPLPLAGAAEQLYILGTSQGYGKEDDSGLVRVFLSQTPSAVRDGARSMAHQDPATPSGTPLEVSKLGFIGLGAMGQGMASSLVRAGFAVHGYDVWQPAVDKFTAQGGKAVAASTPGQAADGSEVLILMVQNISQAEDVLFGAGKAAEALPDGATVVICSTVPPSGVTLLEKRLESYGKGISLVDSPVSGGVARAANGSLTMICSGRNSTLTKIKNILLAMAGVSKNLYFVQGGVGAASSTKLINQLLAGVHIAVAAEAMAFAARLGLDTRFLADIICNATGYSWMFQNRVPQMLDGDWTPHSALAIFVKDLGIVLDETKRLSYYAPMSSAAHNLYIGGAAHGWTKEADAGVVRLWENLGVSVSEAAGKLKSESPPASNSITSGLVVQSEDKSVSIPAQATLDSLPQEHTGDVLDLIHQQVSRADLPVLVVLDDDPTGTQTCHDINVLTVWDVDIIKAEFDSNSAGFFILTNSRALAPPKAKELILQITRNVKSAAEKTGKKFEIVLRGDSTLRGHLPEEPEAVEEVLGQFDAWVVAPFFFQGGRYTIEDVHYIKEDDALVPVSHTPFAQDATFGYRNSNLRKYIQEKCNGRFKDEAFLSITIDDIRVGGPEAVTNKLLAQSTSPASVIIVNAAAESDMHVFVAGLIEAEKSGRNYLFRTGAAFVSSRLGIRGIPPRTLKDLGVFTKSEARTPGGLTLAGSYVPKTTKQLEALRRKRGDKLKVWEIEVSGLLSTTEAADAIIDSITQEVSKSIANGNDVLVMTSRDLFKGPDALSSLDIGSKVASALVRFLSRLEVRPRYVIAKGGITSSDAATKGLNMKRVRIVGQAAPGVPLWRCDEETSRHRGVPYVVFPGNVGTDTTLADLVEAWSG